MDPMFPAFAVVPIVVCENEFSVFAIVVELVAHVIGGSSCDVYFQNI